MNKYMKMAIKEASIGISKNDGGPFGSVIVKDGKVIAKGHNCVVLKNDPTAHGEMEAIRKATKKLGTFDLSGCELYTTAEPCPMCLCASMWANISKIYYGCTIMDTEDIGFRDNKFYETMQQQNGFVSQIEHEKCLELFQEYKNINDKTNY